MHGVSYWPSLKIPWRIYAPSHKVSPMRLNGHWGLGGWLGEGWQSSLFPLVVQRRPLRVPVSLQWLAPKKRLSSYSLIVCPRKDFAPKCTDNAREACRHKETLCEGSKTLFLLTCVIIYLNRYKHKAEIVFTPQADTNTWKRSRRKFKIIRLCIGIYGSAE